jgi:hypothetical protein
MTTRDAIMRKQVCILFMLTALCATPAFAADPPPKPGSCPHALKPLPRNVDRVVERIVKGIEPEFREKLLKTKREDLVQFQVGWGTGIRNSLCLEAGNNNQLIRSACNGGLCHPEEASRVIMEAVWDRLDTVQRVLRPEQRLSAN